MLFHYNNVINEKSKYSEDEISSSLDILGIEPVTENDQIKFKFDEIIFKDIPTAILEGVFGFCGCGEPKQAIQYILHGLTIIKQGSEGNVFGLENMKKMMLGSSEYFFYYVMENLDMTDHGVGAPGWLTEKGEAVLMLLSHQWYKNLFSEMSESEGE